jgi:non-lysosomal glucosylceramidase
MKAMWPMTKKAMEYFTGKWDADADGVLTGNQPMTLDNSINGNNTWIGSLYLAALEASSQMALRNADTAFSRQCLKIRNLGSRKQDSSLFNGQYYTHIPGNLDRPAYVDGVLLDQLLGQYWANILDLGPLYPPEHVQTAMASVFKYNFLTSFKNYAWGRNRRFVDDDDSGLIITAYPKGVPAVPMSYYGECQAGYEYAAAALMIQSGLPSEGFRAFSAIRSRYDGRKRPTWANRNDGFGSWGGDPFMEVEWGNYYFRSMASWSSLLANQGYVINGPERKIGFRPLFKPDDHITFFSAAEGWGVFRQKRDAKGQWEQLELSHGILPLRHLAFAVDQGGKGGPARVTRNGNALASQTVWSGSQALVTLTQETSLNPGDKLAVEFGEYTSGVFRPRPASLPRDWSLRSWRAGKELRLELRTGMDASPRVQLLDFSGRPVALHQSGGGVTATGRVWNFAWRPRRGLSSRVYFLRMDSRGEGDKVVKVSFLPGGP